MPVSGGKPLDVAIGDLDRANGPDLVASINQSGTTSLAVRLNNGDGTFAPEHLYPLGCVAEQVELTDLGGTNGDNTLDGALDAVVFCVNVNGGYIGRIAGDGTGGFLGPGTFPGALIAGTGDGLGTEGGFQRMAIGDVRPAGSPPIPFWTYYYNAGNFHYLSALCWTYDWETLTCSGAAYNPPQPNTYPPLASGTVADARIFGTATPQAHGSSQVGRTDRLVAWGNFPGASPPPGTTITGTERAFGASAGIQSPPWQSIAIGDLAGDGPDIITAEGVCGCIGSSTEPAAGKVSVLSGNLAEGVVPAATPVSFDSALGVLSIAVGDIDRDGKQDVIGVSHTNSGNKVFVHRGDGAGGLAAPETIDLPATPDYSRAPIQLADFDRNGSLDAVVITDAIQILTNKSIPPVDPNDPVNPTPINPLAGLSGLKSSVKADKKGIVGLGTAKNPPTSSVDISITIPKPKPKPKGKDPLAAKTLLIGQAKVTIPAGEEKSLKLKLKSKGRKLLKKGKLKAKVTLVATATDGTEDTKTQALKIKPAKK